MGSGMKDMAYSLKMRDAITRMAEEVVKRMRPADRYGVVQSIDTVNNKCSVLINGDPDPITVSLGAVQPGIAGQTVRVGGSAGDKFVKDILGVPVLYGGLLEEVTTYTRRAQVRMTCGGILGVDSSLNISWTSRIIAIALGRSANVTTGGFHEIVNPVGYTVTNKSLTSGVATLTVASHKLRVGENITVSSVDATFNGAYVVTSTTTTSISYAKAASDVTSVAASGVVAPTIRGHGGASDFAPPITGVIPMATWDALYYEIPYGLGAGTTPGKNGVVSVTNKALTSNVATLTVTAPHYFAVGDSISVAISDAVFDGPQVVTGVTGTTVIYAKTNANVTSVAATGYIKSIATKTLNGNFHKTNYTADFVVPSNWVLIAQRQGDGTDSIVWWNGRDDTGWIAATYQNSWVDYGSGFDTAAYRKLNGNVYLKGLMKNGTIGSSAFTLPAGFRPLLSGLFSGNVGQAIKTTSAASAGTAHTHTVTMTDIAVRVDIAPTGTVTIGANAGATNAYCSVTGIIFPADQ